MIRSEFSMTGQNIRQQSAISFWSASFSTLTYTTEIGKTYRYETGSVHSMTGGNGYDGRFVTKTIRSMQELATIQDTLGANDCLIAGTSTVDADYGKLGYWENNCHERTKEWFPEPFDCALVTLDIDREGAPEPIQTRLANPGSVADLLFEVIPEAVHSAVIVRPSSSNGVLLPDRKPAKKGGWHVHLIAPPGKRVDVMERLYAAFARAGYAWIMVSAAPSLLKRNIVDTALLTSNQPIFSAPPRVEAPLQLERPRPFIQEGCVFDPNWLPDEGRAEVEHIYDALKLAPEVQSALSDAAMAKAEATVPGNTVNRERVVSETTVRLLNQSKKHDRRHLGPDFVIELVDGFRVTVAEILRDRASYHRAKTLTPGEEDYRDGAQTGIIYTDGTNAILHTQAHGGITYTLLPFDPEQLLKEALDPGSPVPAEFGVWQMKAALDQWVANGGKTAIRATMGLGKTRAAVEMIVGDGSRRYLYLAPTVQLARDAQIAYAATGARDSLLLLGRSQPDPGRPELQMCRDMTRVERALAFGVQVNRTACAHCELNTECGYKRQEAWVKKNKPRVVFAAHDYAHVPVPGKWEPDCVIVDETLRTGGLESDLRTPVEGVDILDLAGCLDRHQVTFDPLNQDPKYIAAHRLRAEVLQALIEQEHHYRSNENGIEEYVVPRVRPFLYPELPTLVIDGTFRQVLAELYFGTFDNVVRIDVERKLYVIQITGNSMGITALRKDAGLRDRMQRLVEKLQDHIAIFTYKSAVEMLGLSGQKRVGHFGNIRGRNDWEAHNCALVLGQMTVPTHVVEIEAKVLANHYGLEVDADPGKWTKLPNIIEPSQGEKHEIKVLTHPDPLVQALMASRREDEVVQDGDRLRTVWHEGNPKVLMILGAVKTEFLVDRVISLSDFEAGRLYDRAVHASMTGDIPSSPEQAVRIRPDVFTSVSSAKRDYKRLPPGWKEMGFEARKVLPHGGLRHITVYKRPDDCEQSRYYRELVKFVFKTA